MDTLLSKHMAQEEQKNVATCLLKAAIKSLTCRNLSVKHGGNFPVRQSSRSIVLKQRQLI